jgi:hypothetical protein
MYLFVYVGYIYWIDSAILTVVGLVNTDIDTADVYVLERLKMGSI